MRTVGDLPLIGDTVGPLATVSSAVRLMAEKALRVVAVVDDGQFRGIVTRDRAQFAAPDAPLREVLETLVIEMPASTPVRSAARLFVENGLDFVPVFNGSEYIGLLTANQLLVELGRSWDPITGLSWSDRLRDWGVESLERGREIVIAFFDLDEFGAYNKRHGHIVGDRILQAMAKALLGAVDPDQDILVRYGGDEFVIGTTRTRAELEEKIAGLTSHPLVVEGVPEEVTFTVGYAGGKRSRERERVHYASTVDNLINMASRDSLSRKPKRPGNGAAPQPHPHFADGSCTVETRKIADRTVAVSHVKLGESVSIGLAETVERDPLGVVCESVSDALASIRPELATQMVDVVVYRRWDGLPVALVEAEVSQRGRSTVIRASAASSEAFSAVGEAMLQAMLKGSEELARNDPSRD